MWLRSVQARTASGWNPNTSDSTRVASVSQLGMSTQANPPSRSSSDFRSVTWWSWIPPAATQRTSIPSTPARPPPWYRRPSGGLAQAPGGAGAGVGDLHAEGSQLGAQAVGGGEVAGRAGLLPPGDQLLGAGGRRHGGHLGQVQPEQPVERGHAGEAGGGRQRLVALQLGEHRQRPRRVQVVLDGRPEPLLVAGAAGGPTGPFVPRPLGHARPQPVQRPLRPREGLP